MRTNILQVRKTLLALFAMLMPLVASAHDFEVDGIYYNIISDTDKTVEVTYKGNSSGSYNEYSGSITFPATVTYNGVNYSVTSIGGSAFSGCSSLTAIILPESVTSIGSSAFSWCSNLTSITIPEGVTSIGYNAFYYCSSLTTINIPEGVTSIGDNAFFYCSSLTAITTPESVTSIGNGAFYGTEWYNNQPDGVVYIGKVLYEYKGTMPENTAIEVKEGTVSISPSAFLGCSSLMSITIPEGVTSIGDYAFYDCIGLKTVINYSDLPLQRGSNDDYGDVGFHADRVINIDEVIDGYAFKTIEGVHYLTGYIGDKTELTLPADYKGENYQIGEWAFYECSSLTTINIPEDSKLTSIGESAFAYCSSLTAITIPESVTSIGSGAFSGCSSLTAITLPESVTSIGSGAFSGCGSLAAIVVAEGNKVYDSRNGCNAIIETCSNTLIRGCSATIIPESVTSIGGRAFSGCSSLIAITLPESVTSIGNVAFSGCSSLKTVINYSDLPLQRGSNDYGYVAYYADRVIYVDEVIDGYAFKTIEGVHYLTGYIGDKTELTLPADYKGENYQIGECAFYKCSSLTAINIPEGVTSIGNYAFEDCSSLTTITIPENSQLTSIGERAFYYCSSLKTVINYSDLPLQRGSNDYGNVAYYADRVINLDEVIDGYAFKTIEGVHYLTGYIGDKTELTLPADYKGENYQIGERAFYNCSSLTAINIPEGVTSIGNYAFYECSSLKELTLGKGLKKIAAGAFNSCTALEKITIYATRPPSIDDTGNAFFSDATYENATLYVPQSCIDKYQVMTGWSGFYTIEEMEGGTPNYLTLRQADNGEVGIVVDLGRTYKVRITAFEGWKIHSVTFNDTDVTAQLTEEGTFTTPALQADAVLNIAYEKTDNTTMVANTTARAIKVQGHHGTLRITGTTQGEAISVYTTDGMLVAQESAEESETQLTLPTGQVYIVTVVDKVVKIGL